jgi:hypothetical protein
VLSPLTIIILFLRDSNGAKCTGNGDVNGPG